jgi:hypothetical protein
MYAKRMTSDGEAVILLNISICRSNYEVRVSQLHGSQLQTKLIKKKLTWGDMRPKT